jgi:hypothetical protein
MLLGGWIGFGLTCCTLGLPQSLAAEAPAADLFRGISSPNQANASQAAGNRASSSSCSLPLRREPVPSDQSHSGPSSAPVPLAPRPDLLTPVSANATSTPATAGTTPAAPPVDSMAEPAMPLAPDYRLRLRPTALGWPILQQWCVWVEPAREGQPADRWQRRWSEAVQQALAQWQQLLPLQQVEQAEAAQIRLWRRRPPRQPDATGRLRASHGRALLRLMRVDRGEGPRLEPLVEVVLSPDQRQEALQATALHELGHALGLWGHSEARTDVMAALPGPQPILQLSPRDRATLAWLYSQPTAFGQPTAFSQSTAFGQPTNFGQPTAVGQPRQLGAGAAGAAADGASGGH